MSFLSRLRMPSERDLIRRIRSDVTSLVQAVAGAESWHGRWLEQAEQKHQDIITEIEMRYQQATEKAQRDYDASLVDVTGSLVSFSQSAGLLAASWDDTMWNSWAPARERSVPTVTRVGHLTEAGQWDRLTLPALLPVIGGRNVLVKASGAAKATAIEAIQSLMLRLLAAVAPGKLQFILIDPVGLGQNVASFMHLGDYDERLVGGKVWTEGQHIEAQLAGLTEHMEFVIQKFLRDRYRTMEAYNVKAGEVAEPYRALVVMNFPVNFNESAARRLVSIASNGPRCGVHTLVSVDTEQPLPHGFNLSDMERNASVIAWEGKRFVWEDEDFRDCLLELDASPPIDIFNKILPIVGAQAKDASRVEVPFEKTAPSPQSWWTGDASGGLVAPLGRVGAAKVQVLDLGQGTAQHVLVVGKTGSGKSNLLHVLIISLALGYSPEEVELYLVDFKKGVEFKTYATQQLPHARVVAIESEREFGLSVVQGLDAELKRRGDLFRASGVDQIADYRAKNGQCLPRILLLVDEFQEFFVEDDTIASQASMILDRLVRQGRAFGMHVLLGSQTLAGAYTLARSTIDQMAVRIALQCSEADSRLILADDNSAARLLSRPGEAIYNAANGLVEGNNLFQVTWLPDEERDAYLHRIHEMAQQQGYIPPHPQIVFEGNAPAEVEKNRLLSDLLTSPSWPVASRRVSAWLGDPIAIKAPTAAHFRRQTGSNLLIVGQRDEQAMGIVATALISLAAQHTPELARFYVLDFSPVDAPYASILPRLARLLPHPAERGRRRELPDLIGRVAAEVEQRLEKKEPALWEESSIYLVIYGLQRARDLRQEDDFGFPSFDIPNGKPAPPTPAKQLATILQEGPDLGVHTLIWCDTYTNLTRTFSDRRLLREFEMRVVFQLSAEDSSNLIDSPAASRLGAYQALYFGEEEGQLEKFRPYGLPSEGWLAWVGERLRERGQV